MSARPNPDEGPNPYAAPGTEETLPQVTSSVHASSSGYQNQATLVFVLAALLGLQAVIDVAKGVACIVLNTKFLTYDQMTEVVTASGRASNAVYAIYLATSVPFGMFLVRANKNARTFGMSSTEHSPAAMVWWFFVPLLNLVKPYQAVNAVWGASAPREGNAVSSADGNVVLFWWMAWVVNTFGTTLIRMATGAPDAADAETNNVLLAVQCALNVVLCALALRMVQSLHARQERRAAEEAVAASGSRERTSFDQD